MKFSVHLSQTLDKRLLKVDNQHKPICFLIVEYTCYLLNNNLSIANIKPLNKGNQYIYIYIYKINAKSYQEQNGKSMKIKYILPVVFALWLGLSSKARLST